MASPFFSTTLPSARKDFTVKYGQNGGQEFPGQFDTYRTQNKYDSTLLVDSIRFLGFRNNDTAYSNGASLNNLAVLDNFAVRFKVGDMFLMRDFVPIGLLCSDFDGNRNNVSRIMGTAFQRASRQWKLPAPMLVKPHWTMECEIKQMTGPFFGSSPNSTFTFSVWIEYVGRLTDNQYPRTILYPFVMSYNPTDALVYQSWTTDRDLYNSTSRPVRIQKIVGRQYLTKSEASPDELKFMLNHDTLAIAPDAVLMRLTDSFGYSIVPESLGNPSQGLAPGLAPFGLAMDMYRAQQSVNRWVYPNGFITAEFHRTTDSDYSAYSVYPWIAAIATQEAPV